MQVACKRRRDATCGWRTLLAMGNYKTVPPGCILAEWYFAIDRRQPRVQRLPGALVAILRTRIGDAAILVRASERTALVPGCFIGIFHPLLLRLAAHFGPMISGARLVHASAIVCARFIATRLALGIVPGHARRPRGVVGALVTVSGITPVVAHLDRCVLDLLAAACDVLAGAFHRIATRQGKPKGSRND